ncbi:centrosomal protein 15 kDa [Phycodurus eques]|uniref:centrosomal protein 15 kDa n=1 Tax=Phycodurus eques TaxID=693459 RepID=UPI002ACD58DE|nr:centrosomal protein 15 kDa [Phycodurus eques]
MEVFEKHEEILSSRAQLLEQMKSRRETLKIQSKQQCNKSEVARQRNNMLRQNVQKLENHLCGRPLHHPNVLALETSYWASVEKSIPIWEHFLLGKEPHPTDCAGPFPKRALQEHVTAKEHGLPPRPKSKPA